VIVEELKYGSSGYGSQDSETRRCRRVLENERGPSGPVDAGVVDVREAVGPGSGHGRRCVGFRIKVIGRYAG